MPAMWGWACRSAASSPPFPPPISATVPAPEKSSAAMMGAPWARVSFATLRVEHRALLGVRAAPVPDAHAEHLLEGRLARLDAGDEIGPGAPILLDHDLNFLSEAG